MTILTYPTYPQKTQAEGHDVSVELLFEGGGTNSGNTNGYMRRFNGMSMTNTTGMFFDKGAIIRYIEFTCRNTVSNRSFRIFHYDMNGGNAQLVYDELITDEGNRAHFANDLNIVIPGRRRFAPFITGGGFQHPQYRIGYQRIL